MTAVGSLYVRLSNLLSLVKIGRLCPSAHPKSPPYFVEGGDCREVFKRDELASRIFEDEVNLAYAVIEGIQHRASQGQYAFERLIFN